MPNWADVNIEIRGKKDAVKEVYENTVEHGYDWGKTKMPAPLKVYTAPCDVVSKEEWREYAKECRKYKKDNENSPCRFGLSKIKDSVVNRCGANDWYDWALKNWGTKWNIDKDDLAHDISCSHNKDECWAFFSFMSPWNGPYEWFVTIVKEYGLSGVFEDGDSGMFYYRKVEAENGEIISEYEGEYSESPWYEPYDDEE